MKKNWFSFVLPFLFVLSLSAQQPSKDQATQHILMMNLDNAHFNPISVADTLSKRTFSLFLKRLDYSKTFLVRSDVDQLKTLELKVNTDLRADENHILPLATAILKERLPQAQRYYREFLSAPFDFSTQENFQNDPEKRGFAKDTNELREVWRKSLKLQVLQQYIGQIEDRDKLLADTSAKKAGTSAKKADTSAKVAVAKPPKTDAEIEADIRSKILKNFNDYFDRLLKESDNDRMARFLGAVASSYDPHTEFFAPKDKENFDIQMSGALEGIGATLRETDGYIKVESLVIGGPAWKKKELQAEDLILKVAQGDGDPVEIIGMRLDDAVRLIRGKKGTEVRLTIKKPSGEIVKYSIIRDVIIIEETYAKSAILTNSVGKKFGYTFLPKFYLDFNKIGGHNCTDDMKVELEKLNQDNVAGMILDLRNNGGGSLEDAVKISGLFFQEGPVVQVRGRNAPSYTLSDTDRTISFDKPVIVLVNEFSASASEILSAALQDYSRAVIVGSPTTFGKGTVQAFWDLDQQLNPIFSSLKPLGQVKITHQKFYRVSGHSTQFVGVLSDIILPDSYSLIKTGEKQLDFPLVWDTISAAPHKMWDKNPNIPLLKENSAKRVAANKTFQLIREQAERTKVLREMTDEPLSLAGMKQKQDDAKKESKRFEAVEKELTEITVVNCTADKTEDESKKAKADDWFKQLKKDIYIAEAMAILNDMMGK